MFQTTFKNDVYHIEERLQELDPYLYVMWNPKTGQHRIMDGVTGLCVMQIPQIGFETLDARVYWEMRRIHPETGYNAFDEIREKEAEREREEERQLDDMAEDFAKEAAEAFDNTFKYGPEYETKKYVHGGLGDELTGT